MARGGARQGAGRKPAPHKALNIRLPLATAEAVEKAASDAGLTVSAWVRKAIEKSLNQLEETMTAKTTMLMNPATGSVAPENEWRDDFAAIAPEDRPEVWGGQDFEDGGLVEVIENIPGHPGYDPRYGDWREAE